MTRAPCWASLLCVLITVGWACGASAAAGEPAKAGEPVMVLDQARGSFRAFMRWRTPTLVSPDGNLKPVLEAPRKGLKEEDRKPLPVRAADVPTKGWAEPGFDDSVWPRSGPIVGMEFVSPYLSYLSPASFEDAWCWPGLPPEYHTVCVRGKFAVSDPDRVQGLRFSVGFCGGAVLYVNGNEVCRAHLPAGALTADTLAEPYPREAYLTSDGKPSWSWDGVRGKLRRRSLAVAGSDADGVTIPRALLRKGVNVVALEVRAAPIREDVDSRHWASIDSPAWPHAGVWNAVLTAATADGLVPNVGPRPGIAIANSSPIETVEWRRYAQPSESLFPVRLVGAKNGTFSGKVVLSSTAEFRLTKAAAGDLVREGGGGRIPAAAVQVRWAEPPSPEVSYVIDKTLERYDRLLSHFPATIAVRYTSNDWWGGRPAWVSWRALPNMAVAPVWVTVRVPADAPAGVYEGTFTIEAAGAAPAKFEVPVEIKVNDWALPNPRDFVARNNIYQSTDSVAQYYKVPLWSDKHFELMGKSVEGLCALGSRVCVLHLVYNGPGFWNSEGMVRWVKKPGGGYDYDFGIADKYMDMYARIVGKPAIVMLTLWGLPKDMYPGQRDIYVSFGEEPGVTVLDPATGKTERMPQPAYGTPENEAFWRPVLAELRKRLEKRGWFDVTAVSFISRANTPSREMVEVYRNIWPDGKWLDCSHQQTGSFAGAKGKAPMPVAFSENVYGLPSPYNPDRAKGRRYPRPRIDPGNGTVLFAHMHGWGAACGSIWRSNREMLAYTRNLCEMMLQRGRAGVGRLGGDFWPLPIGPKGQYQPLCKWYCGMNFAGVDVLALLSPGPDGAIFNETAEAFREGVQVVEAILYLQRAADSKGVPAELAARIEALLDERARYLLRTVAFESSAWQERDDRLFALCAEAARASGGK